MKNSTLILTLQCSLLIFCTNILMAQNATHLFVDIALGDTDIALEVYDFNDSLLITSSKTNTLITIPNRKTTYQVLTLVINNVQSPVFLDADTMRLQIHKDSIVKFTFANSATNTIYQKDRERRKVKGKEAMAIFYEAIDETDEKKKEQFFADYTTLREKERYASYDFFKNTTNPLLKCHYLHRQLFSRTLSFEELKQFYQTINSKEAKQYALYKLCKQKIKTKIYKINKKLNKHFLTDFDGQTSNIQPVLSNKPTYLMIWSATCPSSIKEFKKMRDYEPNTSSFEFVTIAKDTNYKTWKEHIKLKKTNGNHYLLTKQEDDLPYQLWQYATPQGYYFKNKKLQKKDIRLDDFLNEIKK